MHDFRSSTRRACHRTHLALAMTIVLFAAAMPLAAASHSAPGSASTSLASSSATEGQDTADATTDRAFEALDGSLDDPGAGPAYVDRLVDDTARDARRLVASSPTRAAETLQAAAHDAGDAARVAGDTVGGPAQPRGHALADGLSGFATATSSFLGQAWEGMRDVTAATYRFVEDATHDLTRSPNGGMDPMAKSLEAFAGHVNGAASATAHAANAVVSSLERLVNALA